jgi:hypothetical protein
MKNYVNEDNFFITFLAAWASVKAYYWNQAPIFMMMIIGALLCVLIIIASIRHFQENKWFKVPIVIAAIALGFLWYKVYHQALLTSSDYFIVVSLCATWIIVLFIGYYERQMTELTTKFCIMLISLFRPPKSRGI